VLHIDEEKERKLEKIEIQFLKGEGKKAESRWTDGIQKRLDLAGWDGNPKPLK